MKQALVTGATGFIGGRLVEALHALGVPVVALVHRWSRAARIARLPITMLPGDLLDLESLLTAARGCDVVFNCAVDQSRPATAQPRRNARGAEHLMQVAGEAGVDRVVHLSSVAVYGYGSRPDAATEDGAYRYSGDPYCDGKIEAEKVVLRYGRERGLPVTVLRPTIVYGPFSAWSGDTARAISAGQIVLVDGGSGICNALYVDNLIQAMLLAATRKSAIGQVFHVSDAEPVTWRRFVQDHAAALGRPYPPIRELTSVEISRQRAASQPSSLRAMIDVARHPDMRRLIKTVPLARRLYTVTRGIGSVLSRPPRVPTRSSSATPASTAQPAPPSIPSQAETEIYTTSVVFRIDRAREILGYRPSISFDEGMARTADWIRWVRL